MTKCLNEVFERAQAWQNSTVPHATLRGQLNHMREEIEEVSAEEDGSPKQRREITDLQILLIGVVNKSGMSFSEFYDEIAAKIDILETRTHHPPDENGVIRHVK